MSESYAELHCLSNFSFLRGASHPEELVRRAHELGYAALAITDECSLAGAVRAHMEAKRCDLKLIIGSELHLDDGPVLVLLATDREGYAQLSALITRGRRAAEKGEYRLTRDDLARAGLDRCLALWLPGDEPEAGQAAFLSECFPGRLWIAVELLLGSDDAQRLESLRAMGRRLDLPLAAAGNVHMHRRGRRALQDTASTAEASLEEGEQGPALRIDLSQVKGLSQAAIERIIQVRNDRGSFNDPEDLKRRARLAANDLEALAAADALRGLAGHRHKAFWDVAGDAPPTPLFPGSPPEAAEPLLTAPAEIQDIAADYAALGFSLRRHSVALLRRRLSDAAIHTAAACRELGDGATAAAAGLVICRQRPGSASGVIFLTLEDETGHVNVVVWPRVAERQRRVLLRARLMSVHGTIQLEQGVLHLVADRLRDHSDWLGALQTRSRDFC